MGAHNIKWRFINMKEVKEPKQVIMLTSRYWISMTIKNMRASNLDEGLVARLGDVNLAIDDIVFKAESNFAKWARSVG